MLETTANMLRSPSLMLLCHAIPLEMHRSMEVWQPMVLYLNYSDLIHFHVNIAETLPYIYEYHSRIAGC